MSEEIKKVVPEAETEPAAAPVASEVRTKLAEYGADEATIDKVVNDLGVEDIDDLTSLEVADLTGAGMKLAKARKLLSELKAAAKPAAEKAAPAAETPSNPFSTGKAKKTSED